ncbi:MAG: class I lanthipeptide [Spirosomataceae bacterium]
MKKTVNKLTLKTDKIVSLSKNQAQQVHGGAPSVTFDTQCNCPTGLSCK